MAFIQCIRFVPSFLAQFYSYSHGGNGRVSSPPYTTHLYLYLPPVPIIPQTWSANVSKSCQRMRDLTSQLYDHLAVPILLLRVEELYATRKRMGGVNWEWKDPSTNKPHYFYVHEAGSSSNVPTPGAIEAIARAIRSHTLNKVAGQ